jgi:hypothetical protein
MKGRLNSLYGSESTLIEKSLVGAGSALGFTIMHFTATDKHFTAIKLFWCFRQTIIKCLS